MQKPLCIYHAHCADGFAAAWAVRRRFGEGNVDFHPASYGQPAPDVTGREVIIVDFSYKRPELLAMAGQAKHILIIDHHESAQRELVDLPANVETIFDMDHSGCMLTWNYYFQDNLPPKPFYEIEDRDLWKFEFKGTREIVAALYSYPMDFYTWDYLLPRDLALHTEGSTLIRAQDKTIADLIAATTRHFWFGQVRVPVANVPHMFASEVGGKLAIGQPFAATYYDDADGRKWSLRSAPDGANVARIAEQFGGGGHTHAAGFRQTAEEAIDFELASAEMSCGAHAQTDENEVAA